MRSGQNTVISPLRPGFNPHDRQWLYVKGLSPVDQVGFILAPRLPSTSVPTETNINKSCYIFFINRCKIYKVQLMQRPRVMRTSSVQKDFIYLFTV